jgi:diguanylate cyclase (GGDEF)-like protein
MGLRRRILFNNLATLAIAAGGMLLGLAAGNLLWRNAQARVEVIEGELKVIDDLNLRIPQAIPADNHYQPFETLAQTDDNLANDSKTLRQFISHLERLASRQGESGLAPDMAPVMANLITQCRSLLGILEQVDSRLNRTGNDPAIKMQAVNSLVQSETIVEQACIGELEKLRARLTTDLATVRGAEERAELLELLIPLCSTFVATGLALWFALRTSRAILRPIDLLNQRIGELRSTGNLQLQPLEQGCVPHEIRALNENFNGLIQWLSEVLAQLEKLSLTDPLTQVGNRRCFDQLLYAEASRHRREGASMALLLLDLDHFKAYNDCYGHPAGDRCLIAVAALLKDLFRRSGDQVCRIGGEEFAVILPGTNKKEAECLAGRIVAATVELNLEHRDNPPIGRVSVSVGVSSGRPSESLTGSWLLQAADQALYRCKGELGRNTMACAPSHDS